MKVKNCDALEAFNLEGAVTIIIDTEPKLKVITMTKLEFDKFTSAAMSSDSVATREDFDVYVSLNTWGDLAVERKP